MSSPTIELESAALPTDETVTGNRSVFVRLTVMMLFEFIVFGSWFAILGQVMATAAFASPGNKGLLTVIGTAYSLAAVAAIVAPMFLGAVGDRFLSSQKALGIAQLAGGVTMLFLPHAMSNGKTTMVLVLIFVYMLFFQPTLGLTNSIAFRHLGTNQRLFPYIRVFGTAGWVIAGLIVGWMGLSSSTDVFYVTAVVSFAFGVYSFTLPKTPPPSKGVRFSIGDVVGAKAFRLLKNRNFAVLMGCGLLTSIALGVYNSYASPYMGALGFKNVAGVLAIGQVAEVIFVVTIPFTLRVIGMKWALFAGMGLWGVRFVLFIVAAGTSGNGHWIAILAIALQGICNDFFLVLAAMYIGMVAPVELSAQAQAMLIMVVSGFGAFIGSYVSGKIFDHTVALQTTPTASDWNPMWYLPIGTAIVTAIVWATCFRYSKAEGIHQFRSTPVPATAL